MTMIYAGDLKEAWSMRLFVWLPKWVKVLPSLLASNILGMKKGLNLGNGQ